jgi:prepilin-type N-terminal cleavage/methylation domain-containing protein
LKTFGTLEKRERSAFTLLELLVVMGVIAVLLVAIIPAVNSLSKSSSRKGAIGNLKGAIEQARVAAIKDGQPTYVVFATTLPGSPDTGTVQRYSYKSYAIFEEDPAAPATPKQLSPWRTIPTGASMRSKADPPNTNPSVSHGGIDSLPTGINFPFPQTNSSAQFPFIKFNANGEIESPATDVVLVVFEGFVDNGNEIITGAKDPYGNPKSVEILRVYRLTGRAEPTITPIPSS